MTVPDLLGVPIIASEHLPEDTLLMCAGTLLVGTAPLPWAELTMRKLIHKRLADTYAWLGWKLPTIPPPGGAWAMIRNLSR